MPGCQDNQDPPAQLDPKDIGVHKEEAERTAKLDRRVLPVSRDLPVSVDHKECQATPARKESQVPLDSRPPSPSEETTRRWTT